MELVSWLQWTPPGQLGEAIATAPERPLLALLHVALGIAWSPLLAKEFARSARRLAGASPGVAGAGTGTALASPIARVACRLCGDGPAGAIAWRSVITRFRTPRTALEAVTGAGVGLAAVLVPTLTRDTAGSGAVLVGGAVQLSVLFMSGNSFGSDGPPVMHELLAGVGTRELVIGKARSIGIVAAPLAIVGPLLAASITGEWEYLVAGIGVGVGALLAGTGAAVVQLTLVPIAMPESDNPFASGESGKGMLAGLLLCVVLAGLAVATIPVALGLLWATDREPSCAGDGVLGAHCRRRLPGGRARRVDRQPAVAAARAGVRDVGHPGALSASYGTRRVAAVIAIVVVAVVAAGVAAVLLTRRRRPATKPAGMGERRSRRRRR